MSEDKSRVDSAGVKWWKREVGASTKLEMGSSRRLGIEVTSMGWGTCSWLLSAQASGGESLDARCPRQHLVFLVNSSRIPCHVSFPVVLSGAGNAHG